MKQVLYVPLDDRPVNLDDVITQGRTAGIRVITPDKHDMKNRLDSQAVSSGSTLVSTDSPAFGNTAQIRRFILKHAAAVDGFIISADMLAYGGLIGSRRLRTSGGGTYPDYDAVTTRLLDVIRLVKQSFPNKPVYVLDTIMRLATTTFVEGLTYEAYSESRSLMQQARRTFTDFDEILSGYNLSPDSSYGDTVTFNKEQYYNARRHKFKSNRYLLEQLARPGYIDFLAIGVDDSSTQGVQANEIAFVEGRINEWLGGIGGQSPDRAIILPEADGLGHSLMARMANQLHRGSKPKYAVRYYGPDGSTIINPYEYMNVHENICRHIDIIGGQVAADSPDVEIIAITAADQTSGAVSRMASNADRRIPTAAIDFVGQGAADPTVAEALLQCRATGSLLGYSAWNTAGNKIGIALGMAQARYAYLVKETRAKALNAAVNAHGSLLFKRFLKDYYYKKLAIQEVRGYSDPRSLYTNVPYANQNMRIFNSAADYEELQAIAQSRMQTYKDTLSGTSAFSTSEQDASCNVRQIRGSAWDFAKYIKVSLEYDNPGFIWGRAFEITLSPIANLS